MIKQDWMRIVAGEHIVDQMSAEQTASVPRNGFGFESEALCGLQREQSARGIVGCEVIQSSYGCSVRYDSGLQDFGLLAGSRSGVLDGSLADAERWATDWVNKDPDHRYAWTRRP
jgi:hypothetical protein